MKKFKAQQSFENRPETLGVRLETADLEKLLKLAKKNKLRKSELARQMIRHCLEQG